MRKISVCVTPNLLPLYKSNNQIVVVVDVLRATSSITAGMASGIAKILPVATVEECRALQAAGYIAAGERDGKMVEGFTLGNSPFDYMDEKLKGQTIAMTTTNGTLAIHLSEGAKEIVIGSFLNLSSVANYLATQDADILVVCAGWKGKFNLEDTMFAGALVEKLQGQIDVDCDAAVSALYLYQAAQVDLMLFMEKSSHYRRLKHLDVIDDIAFCLSVDHFDCVPVVQNGKEIVLKKSV
jgi:2-phosphosulfolactate phosphatase